MITSRTRLSGLLGYPLRHSLSPLIHNYVFERKKLDCIYLCLEVLPRNLKASLRGLKVLEIPGLNVTLPHKQRIIRYLDSLDREAKILKAVNTIRFEGGKAVGFNTDGRGFIKALIRHCQFNPRGKKVVILGCGGAGWAVGISLVLRKIRSLELYDLKMRRSSNLAGYIKKIAPSLEIKVCASSKDLNLKETQLLINATPWGMKKESPFIDIERLNKDCLVYDLIYNPSLTPLLREAGRRGLKVFNGLSMLVYQAVESENLWFPGIGDTSSLMFKVLKETGFRP